MDEYRNDIAAGKTSIQSTLYSTPKTDDNGNEYVQFISSFPQFDRVLKLACDGDYDIGGKVHDSSH